MTGTALCSFSSVRLSAIVMRYQLVQDVVETGGLLCFLICLKIVAEKETMYLCENFLILIDEESGSKKMSAQAVMLSALVTFRYSSRRALAGVEIHLSIDDLSEDGPGKARHHVVQQEDPREVSSQPVPIVQLFEECQHAGLRQ